MGCYGIGINRIAASAIEAGNDENGIIFPISIAPFEVIIVSVNQDDAEVVKAADKIYGELENKGIEVLLDDRDERGREIQRRRPDWHPRPNHRRQKDPSNRQRRNQTPHRAKTNSYPGRYSRRQNRRTR